MWCSGGREGHPQFVYVAAKHGALVVENAFEGAGRRIDYSALPPITFGSPRVLWVKRRLEVSRSARA
jgi:mercuric reductase